MLSYLDYTSCILINLFYIATVTNNSSTLECGQTFTMPVAGWNLGISVLHGHTQPQIQDNGTIVLK